MAKLIKCRYCGSDEMIETDSCFQCAYCQRKMAKPNVNEEQLNRADHKRVVNGDFEAAMELYDEIIRRAPDEAEAYWGRLLCRYGIQYAEDPSGVKIPTCRRTVESSIFEDVDYGSAMRYANEELAADYQRQAEHIDALQKRIFSIMEKEEPYDVFISFKNEDEYGYPTEDQKLAEDIYNELKDKKHLRVFYSNVTLKDIPGADYEPYIFAALTSAPIMVLVGTKPEYIESAWVKNEWSRFDAMVKESRKTDRVKRLIPVLKGMRPEQLPAAIRSGNYQAVDLTEIGADLKLYRGIKMICDDLKKDSREEQERRHREEELRRLEKQRAEEERRQAEDAYNRQLRREEASAQAAEYAKTLCRIGYDQLRSGDFGMAGTYFKKALENDRKCARAHWGKLLVMQHKSSDEELARSSASIMGEPLYKEAICYATAEEKVQFENVANRCQANLLYHAEVKSLKQNHERNFAEKRVPFDERADRLYDAYFAAKNEHKQLKEQYSRSAAASFRLPRLVWLLLVEAVLLLTITFGLLSFIGTMDAGMTMEDALVILWVLAPATLFALVFVYGFLLHRLSVGWKVGLGFLLVPACFVVSAQWALNDYLEYLTEEGGIVPLLIGFGALALGIVLAVLKLRKKAKNKRQVQHLKKETESCGQRIRQIKEGIDARSVEQMQELNQKYKEKYGDKIAVYESANVIVNQILREERSSVTLGGV